MSNIPLSNMQEVVELTLFHSILQECIDKGYSPDIRNTTLYPSTTVGVAAYKAAQEAIITAQGFTVEVFNNSNPDYKGHKTPPRIVIITEDPLPGDIGAGPDRIYIASENGAIPAILPPESYDITFSVHIIANNAKQHRRLVSLLANSIPSRGYLPISPRYGLSDFNIFVRNISYTSLPSAIDGLIERVWRYEVKDVFLTEYVKTRDEVALLNQITMEIKDEIRKLHEFQVQLD